MILNKIIKSKFWFGRGKYLNRILLEILHLSYHRQLCNEVESFLANWPKYFHRICYEKCISLLIFQDEIKSKALFWIGQHIWIEFYYENFIYPVILEHRMKGKTMFEFEQNILIEFYYELFLCFVTVDRAIKGKVVLLIEENNSIVI
jgi:hypothetical protein